MTTEVVKKEEWEAKGTILPDTAKEKERKWQSN